ncbi:hypothetical protein BTR23_06795 [Alkalihalophilus pseudofirmus]|nr:hypothetical protein BTR23_06795 [Alkalihalophilus pseudofirmus]
MKNYKLVDTTPMIEILQSQLKKGTSSYSHFERLQEEISNVIKKEIDPNFKGTLQEINVYCKTAKESHNIGEHINLHDLNIKRWLEELHLVMTGSEAVTIDYDQRKGREI